MKFTTECPQAWRSLSTTAGPVPQLHHSCSYRIFWVGRDLLRSACPAHLLKQDKLEQVAQGCILPLRCGEETLRTGSKHDAFCSVLWSFRRMAFCTWLISILLFSMPILLYGGYMLLLTAALMLFSLLFFFTARNTPKCPIQFGPASLKTDYGGSFWLTLATGECSACSWGFCSPS